ncbi:hypothetical protein [Methylomonas sp. ZR1]|uniref:hypothetical protein n=1 Tax=unclassified Methylomonas TaxID=2608980 RepID=UPI001490ED57|nr:hypothetical protein [Methylomonas sp. ZR1]NOV32635.1 hypothetical protein [Methylomonas sp. ZR1]
MKQLDVLVGIVERASGAQPYEPTSLNLSLVERGVEAFDTVSRKLREEFPFLCSGSENMEDSELEQFDGLFAWLAEQLRTFPKDATNPEQCLTNILALAALLECDAQLWDELVKAVQNVPKPLIVTLEKIIKQCRADGQKILEGERYSTSHIEAFLANAASKDWKSVEWAVNHLWWKVWSPAKQHASVALYRLDRQCLEVILEGENDFFEIAAYVLHTPAAQSLHLATVSTNWTFKFWALHHSANCASRGSESYPMEWEILLSEAAKVPDEWTRWLAVLNEYPGRYPQLQEALGNTLASAPDEALDAYVSSISGVSDFGRAEIATALTIFREKAPACKRQRLWIAAFERWERWDFGCTEHSRSLFSVAKSSFDFPVIGYLTECLDSQARAEWIAKLQVRAAAIERNWHSDVTPAMSERFKLISIYQLIAHSEAVAAGEPEWLWELPLYKPIWEDGTLYRSLRYDKTFGPSTFSSN